MTSPTILSATIGAVSSACPINNAEATRKEQVIEAATVSVAQNAIASTVAGFYKTQPLMPSATLTTTTTHEIAKTPPAATFQQVYLFEENVAKAFGEAIWSFYNTALSKIDEVVQDRVDSILSKGIELDEKDPFEKQLKEESIKKLTATTMANVFFHIAHAMIAKTATTAPQTTTASTDPYKLKVDNLTREIQATMDTLVKQVQDAGCIFNKDYISLAIALGVYVTDQYCPYLSQEALKLLGQRIFAHVSVDIKTTNETDDELLAKGYLFLESCSESLQAVLTAWKEQNETIPVEECIKQRRKVLAKAKEEGIQFVGDLKLPAPQKVVVPTSIELLFPVSLFLKNI